MDFSNEIKMSMLEFVQATVQNIQQSTSPPVFPFLWTEQP